MAMLSYGSVETRTYSFATNQGRASNVTIPTSLPLDSYDLEVKVSKSRSFRNMQTAGTVFYNGDIVINFTAPEVDALQDGFYRIMAQKADVIYTLVEGAIDYLVFDLPPTSILDGGGQVRTEFIEPLTAALDETFLTREEYVAGAVNMEVVEESIQTRLNVHVSSATPHSAYDADLPSLKLLFENGLI